MSGTLGFAGRQPLFKYAELQDVEQFLYNFVNPLDLEVEDVRKSVGRYVAEDVLAPRDHPPASISHVDGYAISTCREHVYRVVDKSDLDTCEAKYVETGQPVPERAVAVVPVESVSLLSDRVILVRGHFGEKHEIIEKGSDVHGSSVVCRKGQRITPQLARLLLELGFDSIKVYRRPRVSIVPTGSEFASGMRRESTSIVVKSMCEAVGGLCHVESPVEDSPAILERAISAALEEYDTVVTIGGVSMGLADQTVRGVLGVHGAVLLVRGLKVQPGRATTLAIVRGKPVVMLPGLIQSTVVGGVFLLQPVLKRLQGSEPRGHYPLGLFKLAEEYEYTGRFSSFTRVRFAKLVNPDEMEVVVEEAPSPLQRVVVESHGFVVLKPGETRLEKGSLVKLYRAPGLYAE